MKYFDISTIKAAIERLQDIKANWLLPAFVFAANDVGVGHPVDLSKKLGTDQFLDRYFNGKHLGLPPTANGNNLLRPRLKGVTWDKGEFAGDYMVRQDTKMWGNLFSSRGYREMRLAGLIEGEKAITSLTDAFQPRFEAEVPATFRFEDFMVWVFAFKGVPDDVTDWEGLFKCLLQDELGLVEFKDPYKNRFKLQDPPLPWPKLLPSRPRNEELLKSLAPKLSARLEEASEEGGDDQSEKFEETLGDDDPVYASIASAIAARESFSFLFAGPPGTGKTRRARQVAEKLTDGDASRCLYLQFHPAIGYEDFVEGFRPVATSSGSGVRYEVSPRVFLDFCTKAEADSKRLHVVVIDELNRGDVARIFGELLTYIETDYRDRSFTLPFSSGEAKIPSNLIVVSTANPYDRSVTDLDDALLRRFVVIEFDPDPVFLNEHLSQAGVESSTIHRTLQLHAILNKALPAGFGHTSFLKVRSMEDLARVWTSRVRMTLKRIYSHDKEAMDSITTDVERILAVQSDDEVSQ